MKGYPHITFTDECVVMVGQINWCIIVRNVNIYLKLIYVALRPHAYTVLTVECLQEIKFHALSSLGTSLFLPYTPEHNLLLFYQNWFIFLLNLHGLGLLTILVVDATIPVNHTNIFCYLADRSWSFKLLV